MAVVEGRGRNVEEAITDALARSDMSREQVDIRIVHEGKSALLGIIGGEDAVVEISPKGMPTNDGDLKVIDQVEEFIHKLITLMDLDLDVDVRYEETTVKVDLTGIDAAVVIGRLGETLRSIEFLTVAIMSHRLNSRVFINVDAEGYMEQRARKITSMAIRDAEQALKTRRQIELPPMTPRERRLVHLALKGVGGVETFSLGEGDERRVVISPRQ